MGTMRKVGERWRAEVRRSDMYQSGNFETKRAAAAWIAKVETEYAAGKRGAVRKSLSDAFERYSAEVSPGKKGARWEQIRLAKLCRDDMAAVMLGDLKASHLADWRDRRLREVSPSSVAREMALIQGVLTIARLEWGWLDRNPGEGVKRPKQGPHRTRRPTDAEIRAIAERLHHAGSNPSMQTQRVAIAFLLACETGMRAGEILSLTAEHCHDRHVHLATSKNGDPRDVPLTPAAQSLIALVKPDVGRLFPLSSKTLDQMFRRARDAEGIADLHFHDSRHLFCYRMSKKVDVMTLAKIIGHRNLSQLLVYYNPSIDEIADRISA